MALFTRIAGTVASYFQIGGPSGPQLKDNSGSIDARNAADGAYVAVRGLDPSGSSDFVTKNYGDTYYGPKATLKPSYATYGSLTITLASLGAAGARASTTVSNATTLYEDALLMFKMTLAASAVSVTGYINVYAFGSLDGGTTYPEGATGTDGAVTLSVPPNLTLVAQLTANTNGQVCVFGPVALCAQVGWARLPPLWGVVVVNQSGAALNGTAGNHFVQYMGVNGQLV